MYTHTDAHTHTYVFLLDISVKMLLSVKSSQNTLNTQKLVFSLSLGVPLKLSNITVFISVSGMLSLSGTQPLPMIIGQGSCSISREDSKREFVFPRNFSLLLFSWTGAWLHAHMGAGKEPESWGCRA